MASSSVGSLSPSIVGSAVRFRRLVILIVVVCAVIALIYTAIAGSAYTAKAQLVIQQPPTFLPPFPVSGSHTTAASYVNQQVAIIESQAVSYGAAAIVNNRVNGADVSGNQIHSGLTVKPQTGAAAGTNTTTQILVTMPTAELAAASANAVVASYITALHGQISAQANQSINALNKEIATVKAELGSLPSPTTGTKSTGSTGKSGSTSSGTGSSGKAPHTTTTVIKVPKTTTTRVPRTTTTRVPRTTTTKPAPTTTTSGGGGGGGGGERIGARTRAVARFSAAHRLPSHGDNDDGGWRDHDDRSWSHHDHNGPRLDDDHHRTELEFVFRLRAVSRREGPSRGHSDQPHALSLPGAGRRAG